MWLDEYSHVILEQQAGKSEKWNLHERLAGRQVGLLHRLVRHQRTRTMATESQ